MRTRAGHASAGLAAGGSTGGGRAKGSFPTSWGENTNQSRCWHCKKGNAGYFQCSNNRGPCNHPSANACKQLFCEVWSVSTAPCFLQKCQRPCCHLQVARMSDFPGNKEIHGFKIKTAKDSWIVSWFFYYIEKLYGTTLLIEEKLWKTFLQKGEKNDMKIVVVTNDEVWAGMSGCCFPVE